MNFSRFLAILKRFNTLKTVRDAAQRNNSATAQGLTYYTSFKQMKNLNQSRLRKDSTGFDIFLLHANKPHNCIVVLHNQRLTGRGWRSRGEIFQSEYKIRSDVGSAYGSCGHYVPLRYSKRILSGLYVLVPIEHGYRHRLPLDLLAHVIKLQIHS